MREIGEREGDGKQKFELVLSLPVSILQRSFGFLEERATILFSCYLQKFIVFARSTNSGFRVGPVHDISIGGGVFQRLPTP